MAWIVFRTCLETDRQPAGRVDLACNYLSDGNTALLSGVPCHQNSLHIRQPWRHLHCTTGIKHHHYVLIIFQHITQKFLLPVRKSEGSVLVLLFRTAVMSETHYDAIRRFEMSDFLV